MGGPGGAVASSTRNTITHNKAFFERNDGILTDVTATEFQNTFSLNVLKDEPTRRPGPLDKRQNSGDG